MRSGPRRGCDGRRRDDVARVAGDERVLTVTGAWLDPVALRAGTDRSGRRSRRRPVAGEAVEVDVDAGGPHRGRTRSSVNAVSSMSWLGWRRAGIAAVASTVWRRAYDDSEWPGPSSIEHQRAVGEDASRRQSAKRTVWRRWSTQYCGSVACSAVIHVPVRFERYGIVGGESSTPRTASRNSGRIGSSSELWARRRAG